MKGRRAASSVIVSGLALAFAGCVGLIGDNGESSGEQARSEVGEAHSSENMVVLVGGKAGGLHTSAGRHIQGAKRHPVEVINTAMKAVGVDKPLGEVSGTFDELFT